MALTFQQMLVNPCELNHQPKLATELMKIFSISGHLLAIISCPWYPQLNLTLDFVLIFIGTYYLLKPERWSSIKICSYSSIIFQNRPQKTWSEIIMISCQICCCQDDFQNSTNKDINYPSSIASRCSRIIL